MPVVKREGPRDLAFQGRRWVRRAAELLDQGEEPLGRVGLQLKPRRPGPAAVCLHRKKALVEAQHVIRKARGIGIDEGFAVFFDPAGKAGRELVHHALAGPCGQLGPEGYLRRVLPDQGGGLGVIPHRKAPDQKGQAVALETSAAHDGFYFVPKILSPASPRPGRM